MFITRVELHGVQHDHEAYNTLHAAMERLGFSRTITGDSGETFYLPPAEYYCESTLTAEQVRSYAKGAANETQRNSNVLVTGVQVGSIAWELPRVNRLANWKAA